MHKAFPSAPLPDKRDWTGRRSGVTWPRGSSHRCTDRERRKARYWAGILRICKPGLTSIRDYPGARLLREIQAQGYTGGYTILTDYLRTIRPPQEAGYEVRFETPAGHQGQVDFAHFKVRFRYDPQVVRVVWLFSLVLGHSRYLFGRFVWRQTLDVVVACHEAAFAELGGVPAQLLYDRMKTAVLGESEPGEVIYHPTLLALAAHYGFQPKACPALSGQDQRQGGAPVSLCPSGLLPGGRCSSTTWMI